MSSTMSKSGFREDIIHADVCLYKNQIDYVDKLITMYSVFKMDKASQLRQFEKDVLNYYVRFGYSIETKKRIKKELDKNSATITQATFYLTKKGYLTQSRTNYSQKTLNKGLQRLRNNFLLGDKKVLAVVFKLK